MWRKYFITVKISQFKAVCKNDRLTVVTSSGVLGGIRGYTAYTNLRVFLTAYTHLSDHK